MRLLLTAILLAALALRGQAQTAPKALPAKANRPQKGTRLYDSTRVTFAHTLPEGISHKTVQQAVITYGKIGAGQPLDRTDSLFLQQRDPLYLQAELERKPEAGNKQIQQVEKVEPKAGPRRRR